MEVLEYLMAAPESRVVVALIGWLCGVMTGGVLSRVMSR